MISPSPISNALQDLYSFVNASDAGDLLLKTLMCKLGNLSPFWQVDPTRACKYIYYLHIMCILLRALEAYSHWQCADFLCRSIKCTVFVCDHCHMFMVNDNHSLYVFPLSSGFGWLQDPLLMEVQQILYIVQNKSANGTVIPWTTAVPGASTNWTSVEDTRRRRNPDTFKTGKKNPNQVGQYVRYNNMTELWACVVPMDSQNTSVYVDGEMFPACALFQYEWTDEEAYNAGYRKPFATDYANRIWGTDANAFGRPITGDKLAVFISDIYRSCFLQYEKDENWNGVTTRRFHIQSKDLENATANPENAQFYAYGPSGLENTTAATGIPVFVSFPHFLHGDPRLVAAVEGLSPNAAEHESNLDMEPQTGLLTAAHKRLQVNYEMVDKIFPSTSPEDAKLAAQLCTNLTDTIQFLESKGLIPPNITLPGCELTIFTELFTCFGAPVEWKMYDGNIFFPYGWVDESFQLPDDDADDIHDSLFFIDDLGVQVQFWSLITAGILFVIILAMLYRGHLDMLARGQTVWHAFDETSPSTPYKRRNSRGEGQCKYSAFFVIAYVYLSHTVSVLTFNVVI